MNITLLFAPKPRVVVELKCSVAEGCTAKEAVGLTDWAKRYPEINGPLVLMSVWGRKVDGEAVLREGDRLEFCRTLRVDPKVARRERFVGQGARGTGLFAQRRPGSKAGY